MLLCLSFNHRESSFSLLDALSRNELTIRRLLVGAEIGPGLVMLATCNRVELYLDALGGPEAADTALEIIADACSVTRADLEAQGSVYFDREAAEHLFSVTTGLESAALGENEIAGQVRRAHTRACEEGTNSHLIERLFQAAARISRTVKQRTGLGATGRSLVHLALRLASARVPRWEHAEVLLIGTGAYAGATVAALQARGARRIRVHSPSGRAAAWAANRGLEAVDPRRFSEALAGSELIIACSRVEEPLLTPSDFAAAPSNRQRLVIDLGMPRNIDPAVASDTVELLDLEMIGKHTTVNELGAEAEALEIVREAALEFLADEAERAAVPSVLALRHHVLAILEDELCRSGRARAGHEADDEVALALRRFTGRLLHEPMTRLRALGREGRADEANAAIGAVFGGLDSVEQARLLELPQAAAALDGGVGLDAPEPIRTEAAEPLGLAEELDARSIDATAVSR